MTIDGIAEKVRAGGRLDRAEALELYVHAPTPLLGTLADEVRARKHPERVGCIKNDFTTFKIFCQASVSEDVVDTTVEQNRPMILRK